MLWTSQVRTHELGLLYRRTTKFHKNAGGFFFKNENALTSPSNRQPLLAALGCRQFAVSADDSAKRKYANNVSKYNTVIGSLTSQRRYVSRRSFSISYLINSSTPFFTPLFLSLQTTKKQQQQHKKDGRRKRLIPRVFCSIPLFTLIFSCLATIISADLLNEFAISIPFFSFMRSRFLNTKAAMNLHTMFSDFLLGTIRTDNATNSTYCVYDSDVATSYGVGAFLFLLSGESLLMGVTKCMCFGRPLAPGGNRAWTIIYFTFSLLSFVVAEACLIAGAKKNAYHTKYKGMFIYRIYFLRDVYVDMMLDGVKPEKDTFRTLTTGSMKGVRLQDCFFFRDQMKSMGLISDVVLYNFMISTCG
ncbi:unnamed protein product [Lactuca virosa]|uniref:Uncharacterized protein n=1 Tax=Lactuca virosa TaxID=75947 RepID=A0AAU9MGZ0_9ASTR|nr:unnamed protein product [Lactuca virosa]